jgi:hypothetical protein
VNFLGELMEECPLEQLLLLLGPRLPMKIAHEVWVLRLGELAVRSRQVPRSIFADDHIRMRNKDPATLRPKLHLFVQGEDLCKIFVVRPLDAALG